MASVAAGLRSFANEPLTDFRNEEKAQAMRAALAQQRSQLGREYDLEPNFSRAIHSRTR